MIYLILGSIVGVVFGVYRNIYPFYFILIILSLLRIIYLRKENLEIKNDYKKRKYCFLRKNILISDYILDVNKYAVIIFVLSFIFFYNFSYSLEKKNKAFQDIQEKQTLFLVLEQKEEKFQRKLFVYLINERKYGDILVNKRCSFKIGKIYFKKIDFLKLKEAYNPGGFDEKKYYLSNGKSFKGKIKEINKESEEKIEKNDLKLNIKIKYIKGIYILKENLKKIFSKYVNNKTVDTMIFGSGKIDENIKNVYRNLNVYHVLVISGMHISYIISFLKIINIKKENIYILFFLLFSFSLMIGKSASILRSIFMILFYNLFKKFNINIRYIDLISLVFLVILIINPYIVFSYSIYLSFLASIGIKISLEMNEKCKKENYNFNKKSILEKIYQSIKDLIIFNLIIYFLNLPILIILNNYININFIPCIISNMFLSFTVPIIIFLSVFIIFSYPFNYILNLKYLYIFLGNILSFTANLNEKVLIYLSKISIPNIYIIRPNIFNYIIYYIFIYFILKSIFLIKEKKKYILINLAY